jgi:hypothetical protein
METTVKPQRSLELSLRSCAWLALAFIGLSLVFGFVSPPQSWAYVLSGFAFVPLMLGAALVALKFRWRYLEFAIVGTIIAEAGASTVFFPVHLLGGGFDFFQQLNVTLICTYLVLYLNRSRIQRWATNAAAT